ncbi:MAG: Crp/Fnr family transcriptional regulator [Deltaproteobacteria bacterium]|nr:Crp/Fnr family transcriptional regulator [Deltaproteobacteria bacterium]MBW1816305.1 Crp/Fnr family transcriptional regulator [Deltaproteobacteria bacterium]MBW2283622.1 Crp/Fnr family transcriptional regulator [Deltaproteobacteria bacterium]
MIALDELKKVETFRQLDDTQLEAVLPFSEQLNFYFGDRLFKEGDDALHLWHVTEGKVDLRFEMPDARPSTPDQTLSSVEVQKQDPEAKTLGWSCFIPPHKMRLSAYVVTNKCKVIRVGKNDLLRLFNADPLMGYWFMSYMMTVVGYRFQQFQDYVAKNLGEDMISGW